MILMSNPAVRSGTLDVGMHLGIWFMQEHILSCRIFIISMLLPVRSVIIQMFKVPSVLTAREKILSSAPFPVPRDPPAH